MVVICIARLRLQFPCFCVFCVCSSLAIHHPVTQLQDSVNYQSEDANYHLPISMSALKPTPRRHNGANNPPTSPWVFGQQILPGCRVMDPWSPAGGQVSHLVRKMKPKNWIYESWGALNGGLNHPTLTTSSWLPTTMSQVGIDTKT